MFQRTSLAALKRSICIMRPFTLLAILAALFACSNDNDDEKETPSSSSTEEILSSSSIEKNSSSSLESGSLLLNFTSDMETGLLRWMDPNSASLSSGELLFDQDSKVFANGKYVFVLERKNWGATNSISCMQADKIGDKSLITQKSLEDASNPYEVAVVGNKGYIALYGLDYVQEFNPATCVLGSKIDLPISEANAASIKASGDTLLVIAQRLEAVEGWLSATKPGLLIRINASTKTLIDTIPLKFYNPGYSILSKGKLYVSSIDDYFAFANAGIEIVDLAKGTSEVLATSSELGGGAGAIALNEADQILYVSVYEEWGIAPVKPVNLANKAVGASLPNITDSFNGIAFDDVAKKLFVGDSEGLKVYDLTSMISVNGDALPPASLAIARW